MDYRTISTRPEDHAVLWAVAQVRGISLVDLIEECAAWALEELDPDQRELARSLADHAAR